MRDCLEVIDGLVISFANTLFAGKGDASITNAESSEFPPLELSEVLPFSSSQRLSSVVSRLLLPVVE